MIVADELPELTERLIDVDIRLVVSPQGSVVSAVVADPGSGDVRIDRYVLTKALGIVFEAWPVDRGDMAGVVRLRFRDGIQ
jgi:hypothetical protein